MLEIRALVLLLSKSITMHRHIPLFLAAGLSVKGLASSVPPEHHPDRRQTEIVASIYQNASYSVTDRVQDLLQRMTLDEKAGMLFHTQIFMPTDYTFVEGSANDLEISRSQRNSSTTSTSSAMFSTQPRLLNS